MTSLNRQAHAPCAKVGLGQKPATLTLLILLTLPLTAFAQPVAPGFPNVAQTPGDVLSALNAPNQGRTAIIAYHNGLLFTVPEMPSSAPGSDFEVRVWDISNPVLPTVVDWPGITPQPINAHGYLKNGDYLTIGANWPPESPWSFRADGPGNLVREANPDLLCAGVRGCLFGPWFVGDTYWSYNEVSGDATLELDYNVLATWDHLGQTGVIGHPFLLGDLLIFASDQSRTGVATYDVSDPTSPVLLDVLTTGGPGGYWPELWGGEGKLYVVFPYRTGGNGFRVVDVTDPSDLRFLTDTPLPGESSAQYIQFQDEYAFMGDHKVDMRTFESVLFLDGWNTTRPNDGQVGIDTSQFLLPLGNLLVTGGIEPYQGMAIWAHQADPDTRGPYVGYHIPRAGRTNYPLGAPISLLIHETLETPTIVNGVTFIVRPLGGNPISGRLTFSFDDVLTFAPDAPLLADTTYEVVIPDGGITDAAGNGITGLSFTFSTGGAVGGNQPPVVNSFTVDDYPVSPGAGTTLAATASDPDGDALEYRFDFGDGSSKTAWSASTSVAASWAEIGHYRVGVQVRDPSGVIASDSFTVTVLDPPAVPAPSNSSQVVCDDGGRQVLAVNPDNGTLAAVHADSLVADFEVAVCNDPRSVAQSAAGELWVACFDDDSIAVLDSGGSFLTSLPTGHGSSPSAVVFSPDGATAYVALEGAGSVERWDAASRLMTGSLDLGPRPSALALSGDGSQLLVTRLLSPKDHAEVWNVDAATLTLSSTILIPKFGQEENHDGTASGRGVANYLRSIIFSPDGLSAWVAANKPNTERGPFFGPDLDSDNSVRNIVVQIDPATGGVIRAIDLDNSDSASALAFSPLGDFLFVTLQGNNEVAVLDALEMDDLAGLGSLVGRLGTGLAPQGVCSDPTSEQIFVKNLMGRSVSALDAAPLLRRGSLAVVETEVSTVAVETFAPDVLTGKQVFYNASDPRMSSEGYLSCASCHLDGGHDGRVWDFNGRGEGFRNTASLRGRAGMGQGNVHWTANFDEIQDFEGDVRGAFGGSGFLSDADWAATSAPLGAPKAGLDPDLDALAAYVASLGADHLPRSPYREFDGHATSEAETGAVVFASLGCDSCHTGPQLTDSELGASPTLHDVGTLRTTSGQRLGAPLTGIDTPTLLGVWNTAPYFHDGSAPTLEDVFTIAGGEVIQAETGAVSGGAYVSNQYTHLNNDSTVHEEAFVYLDGPTARLTLNAVDGGAGGIGAVEVRYSVGPLGRELRIAVNGAEHTMLLPGVGNDPTWRHTNWGRVRFEGVSFTAGATNTVELFPADPVGPYPNISLDDVLISTADELTLAQPHRQVLGLSGADRNALLAFLRQIEAPEEVDCPNGCDPPLEAGRLSVDHNWQTVFLTETFTDPIVVAKPASLNGVDPTTVRLRNITANSFEIRLQEWNYLNGTHGAEEISFLAVERGSWRMAGGVEIEAGSVDLANSLPGSDPFVPVPFAQAFSAQPVIFSVVGTDNGADAVVTRQRDVTTSGFDVIMQEEQALGGHGLETVYWIAWQAGSGVAGADEMGFEADTLGGVTHGFTSVGFQTSWGASPCFLADMQTTNGLDTANLRFRNLGAGGVEIQIDEEQSADQETGHNASETIGYLALECTPASSSFPEVGRVTATHLWQTVPIQASFNDPIVVAKPASYNGPDPTTVRLRNVSASSFDIRLQEWDYLNGTHGGEEVSYLVVERGSWLLPGGGAIEAGSLATANSRPGADPFVGVSFAAPFPSTPVVLSVVGTDADTAAVATRNRNVGSGGFEVILQEEEAAGSHGAAETIYWIAWQQGASSGGDPIAFEAGSQGGMTHVFDPIAFGSAFAAPPCFLADMQTFAGADPSTLRYRNLTPSGVEVQVDDEQSADGETNHNAAETVGWLAFDCQ